MLAQPPVARRVPKRRERLGIVWTDDYAWLRDPDYPQVHDPAILDYLKAENAYFAASMAPHQALVEEVYAELKGRIKPDDSSVPVVARPATGNHPSWTEKISFSSRPAKNTGVA